tara:strand:- start:1452 stop:2489 length:1038 start_codon:yes stop_codon:yes gene_type:complete
MEVIVPAAGLSTRFPNVKPKYLLFGNNNKMMLHNAIEPFLDEGYNITIGVLKEHDEKFHASEFIEYEYGEVDKLRVVIIDKPTRGPADTVAQIISLANIDIDSPIFIKDCDSFFTHHPTDNNYVCVSKVQDHDVLKKLSSKSFVNVNSQGIIHSIIEKKVVSDTFCVGGYKFESAKLFLENFEEINSQSELFVSDVIQRALFKEIVFSENKVENYVDVGTIDDWLEYNNKPVIFCDIDGTVVVSQQRVGDNPYHELGIPLKKNVKILLEYQEKGCCIVFTTARDESTDYFTRNTLDNLGFKNYRLLSGLPNADRLLINDYAKTNPFPRAVAINLNRDTDDLENFL